MRPYDYRHSWCTSDGSGKGVHLLACLDMHGNRYFNDPLGHHGRKQRRDLERLHPHPFSEDDPEHRPDQKDCGVRSLVALVIGVHCGTQCFLEL
jgi:hypothetical protein